MEAKNLSSQFMSESSLDENFDIKTDELSESDGSDCQQCDKFETSNYNEPATCIKSFIASGSILDTSFRLHDYCGAVPSQTISSFRHQECQTESNAYSHFTQTDAILIKSYKDSSTQTSLDSVDFGIQVNLPVLTFDDVSKDDQKCCFYTGIPDANTFVALFDEISEDAEEGTGGNTDSRVGGRPRTLRLIDDFFMVLMRLRLGLILEDLAFRFCLSSSSCGQIFNKWIDYLEVKLSFLVQWPSREIIDGNIPKLFKQKFHRTRIIVDCTEIKTESPNSLQLKSVMFSDYKLHCTCKSLISISPSGVVTVFDLWGGSISDKKIMQESGLLDLLEPDDAIMADKGFTISDLTTPRNIHLIIPPFKHKGQFSKREVHQTKDIAQARIHVEREMERIKNFRIFEGVMPISMASRASKIWKICVYLTNLYPPLIPR